MFIYIIINNGITLSPYNIISIIKSVFINSRWNVPQPSLSAQEKILSNDEFNDIISNFNELLSAYSGFDIEKSLNYSEINNKNLKTFLLEQYKDLVDEDTLNQATDDLMETLNDDSLKTCTIKIQ